MAALAPSLLKLISVSLIEIRNEGFMSNLDLWKKNWGDLSAPSKMFDRFFEDFYTPQLKQKFENFQMSPNVEAHETKDQYSFKFDLPGVTKDQIKIDLHENTLTVSGERKEEKKDEQKDRKTHLSEVYYGSFMRSFTLPEGVNAEKAEAKFENGVLFLTVPKKESSLKRQISIK